MKFSDAAEPVLGEEGGQSKDPVDPGGLTKYGISQAAYPGVDISNLKRAEAARLLQRDYWTPIRGDELPGPLALATFDSAVNIGVSAASRLLQLAVGAHPDGVVGKETVRLAWAADEDAALVNLMAGRLDYYDATVRRQPPMVRFLVGWRKRVLRIYRLAVALAVRAEGVQK